MLTSAVQSKALSPAWPSHWLMVARATPELSSATAVLSGIECGWSFFVFRDGASRAALCAFRRRR